MSPRKLKAADVAAVIPAAGRGTRLASKTPKPYVVVKGAPLLVHTLRSLTRAYTFSEILVAVDPSMMTFAKNMLARHRFSRVRLVPGGKTRASSVKNAVQAVSVPAQFILVHDAARPLVSADVVRRTIQGAKRSGASLCGIPVSSTVKRIRKSSGWVSRTEDREVLYLAQTPQVFRRRALLARYERLGLRAMKATDEAALFDGSAVAVRLVPGDERNIKVTTRDDLRLFEAFLSH